MNPPLVGHSDDPDIAGVLGEGPTGVYGRNTLGVGNGIIGYSDAGRGVWGHSNKTGTGVLGEALKGPGVHGASTESDGVLGEGVVGVYGRNTDGVGNGVIGYSDRGRGVWGHSNLGGIGVLGESTGEGVHGSGRTGGSFEGSFEGVHAISHDPHAAGVAGYNDKTGPGIYGKSTGGGPAAVFDGDVIITGVINMARADYAEDFTVSNTAGVEPGMVMVLDEDGSVRISDQAYDTRVAGVVSGAGDYRPAVVLDHDNSLPNRLPISLMGKVYCMVDASESCIGIGDLLTTSTVPGHAMKAADPSRSIGSVIGKALRPLDKGRGLIPVLVRLQ
jgi:hypothetical protein